MISKYVNNKEYIIKVENGAKYLQCFDGKFRSKKEIENLASYYLLRSFGAGLIVGMLISMFLMSRW